MKYSDKPLLTVITVVLNAESYIEDTMRSVFAQPYENIDYIVIDGGSVDNTVNIIEKYKNKIKHFVSEKDDGIYDAMNKGWDLADTDSFVLFIGAGDMLFSLPKNMSLFTVHDIVYGDVDLGNKTFFKSRADWHLKIYNSVHHQALLIHKSQHQDPPFDLRYPKYADFDFNQRLFKQGGTFVYDSGFCSYARPDGVTACYDLKESLQVVRKNFGLLWVSITFIAYSVLQLCPMLRRFRPIKQASPLCAPDAKP